MNLESKSTSPPRLAHSSDLDSHAGEDLLAKVDQLQGQLDQLRQDLAHTHRLAALGTVTATVAHEFNNILTPIISYAQLALARPNDHDLMRKAVEKSFNAAERAAKISSAMLSLARDDTTQNQIPVATLPQVIHDALDCLARDPRKDGIELILNLNPLVEVDADLHIKIEHVAMQQVLVNLILNAKRAMHRRGGKLTITGSITENNALLELHITDTGPGVPQAIQHRLFQPFVTQHIDPNSDSQESPGTGLGLSVCQDLIQQAHGQIQLAPPDPESADPGNQTGATFHIQLPIITHQQT